MQHPLDRALAMLGTAVPEMTRDQLADLPVGVRNGELLKIYQQTFGRTLDGLATCHECSEILEFSVSIAEILDEKVLGIDNSHMLSVADHQLEFRSPNSRDLAAIVDNNSVSEGRQILLERCVLSAKCAGDEVKASALPERVVGALSDKITACVPHVDLVLDLECPVCAHAWQSSLDVVSFLWEEISARARNLLYEIHTLALAYGWSEQEILSLGSIRRHHYMEMVL